MILEELINTWFTQTESIASKMATFAGSPAVFLNEAPSDSQDGWGYAEHYPHIVTSVSLQTDAERKSQGILRVTLLCDILETAPETFEPLIKSALKDIMMQPDENPPYCFAWQSTNYFNLGANEGNQREGIKRIAACDMTFDILEYPLQPSITPDPLWGVRKAIKEEFPTAFVLGNDEIEDFRVATEVAPIVYARLTGIDLDRALFSTIWNIAHVSIHVIAPTAESRAIWTREIYSTIIGSGKVLLDDDSPMVIRIPQVNTRVDYLRAGQISIDGLFSSVSPRVQEWRKATLNKTYAHLEGDKEGLERSLTD